MYRALFVLIAFFVYTEASRPMMTGGWSEMDREDEHVNYLAQLGASHASDASNSIYHKKLVGVVGAESQVVAGVNYRIMFELGATVCHKKSPKSLVGSCALRDDTVS